MSGGTQRSALSYYQSEKMKISKSSERESNPQPLRLQSDTILLRHDDCLHNMIV